jgi:hypothetical protein
MCLNANYMERISQPTIVSKFFSERIANYRPPIRKGLKRGEKIGFPLAKERAVLYAMIGHPQKDISETLKISFSLVRHWCCERQFKRRVDEYSAEIVKRFLLLLEEFEKTYSPKILTDLKVPSDFGGLVDYGPDIAISLIHAILERINERMSLQSLEVGDVVFRECFLLSTEFAKIISLYKLAATFHKTKDFRKRLLKSKYAQKENKDFDKGLREVLKMAENSVTQHARSCGQESLGEKLLLDKSWMSEWRLVEPISLHQDWEEEVEFTWWNEREYILSH